MSQPEMQPDGPPRKESDAGSGANAGTERSGSRYLTGARDLTGRSSPDFHGERPLVLIRAIHW